jgi:NAD(P)-dependent dehydrogenase (short-subunit alcohol dehydrogenase family)
MRLDGKVAVVTGGASGIGLAMVRVFVDAGGSVVAADVDDAALASLAGVPGVVAVRTDISQQVDVDALVSVAMGPFLMSRAILPHMLKAGTGVVINISSAPVSLNGGVITADSGFVVF